MTASFRNFIPARPILLDLACGTGSLSIELARLGYDVVGTDASQQMLSEAMLKKEIALYGENFEREEPSDPGIAKLLFLCQPMQELDMYGRWTPPCARWTASTMSPTRRWCSASLTGSACF